MNFQALMHKPRAEKYPRNSRSKLERLSVNGSLRAFGITARVISNKHL